MYSIDPGAPLGSWLGWMTGWWRPPERRWYAMRIVDADGNAGWTEARRLTADEATEWQVDTIEDYWGGSVSRYVWNGSAWVRG